MATNRLQSIAIAGAWGYIGRKILEAARVCGYRVYVYDPGAAPADLSLEAVTRITSEARFYDLEVDCFHLALHPEARATGLKRLLRRAQSESFLILNEKPMVSPEHPEAGRALIEAVDRSRGVMLYDFPELFDPLTRRMLEYLGSFKQVEISSMVLERSKDREDPALARNYKRMVPIQFQESVHCLAYVLYLLATLRGSLEATLPSGVGVDAHSLPYSPPNPEAYPCVVDGRCDYRLSLGRLTVEGLTHFKRGARWTKRRVLRGHADGEPFLLEADYLEGGKYLRINGVDQGWEASSSSYAGVLATADRWWQTVPARELMRGVYPNPRLAWMAFQLSGVLWRSSHERRHIELPNLAALERFDSGYRAARPQLPRYECP